MILLIIDLIDLRDILLRHRQHLLHLHLPAHLIHLPVETAASIGKADIIKKRVFNTKIRVTIKKVVMIIILQKIIAIILRKTARINITRKIKFMKANIQIEINSMKRVQEFK